MNKEEHEILNQIREDIKDTIKDLQKEVIKNRDETQILKTEFVETRADVKNLVGYVNNVNMRIENWTHNGCPHGQVNTTRIESVESKIEDNKEDIKDLKNDLKDIPSSGMSKKQGAGLVAAISVIVTAIVNAVAAAMR